MKQKTLSWWLPTRVTMLTPASAPPVLRGPWSWSIIAVAAWALVDVTATVMLIADRNGSINLPQEGVLVFSLMKLLLFVGWLPMLRLSSMTMNRRVNGAHDLFVNDLLQCGQCGYGISFHAQVQRCSECGTCYLHERLRMYWQTAFDHRGLTEISERERRHESIWVRYEYMIMPIAIIALGVFMQWITNRAMTIWDVLCLLYLWSIVLTHPGATLHWQRDVIVPSREAAEG